MGTVPAWAHPERSLANGTRHLFRNDPAYIMADASASPNLHRLIYTSTAQPGLGLSELRAILETSQANNRRDAVTGALVYDEGLFLQLLEGDRAVLSRTYQRILNDPRHYDLCLIEMVPCAERQFADWAMRHLTFHRSTWQRAVGRAPFDPYAWSASQCYALLLRFSAMQDAA